jgi:putative oxidoreductase
MERLSGFAPQVLSILRIIAGLAYLQHGLMKIFQFPAAVMDGPLPPMMVAAGWLEIVGGVLIALGLFTRPAAFLMSGMMAVAYWLAHGSKGFYPATNGGEPALLFCFIFLYLACAGGGPWSLDAIVRKRA